MVSWIRNTASVTASICLALTAPMVSTMLAQDAADNAPVPRISENSNAPEVRSFPLEQKIDVQHIVAERAKRLAARNVLHNSIKPLPSLPSKQSFASPDFPQPTIGEFSNDSELALASAVSPTDQDEPERAYDMPATEWQSADESFGQSESPQIPLETLDDPSNEAESILVDDSIPAPEWLRATILADSEPPLTTNEAPTVIIRPPVDGTDQLNDCTMEVKQLGDTGKQEYAICLQVPDSVKVIEVLPSQSANSARNFRLRLEQGSEFDAPVFAKPKTPAIGVSSDREVPPRNQNFEIPNLIRPVPELQPVPDAEFPGREGFQQNPFFRRNSARSNNETARNVAHPLPRRDVGPTRALPQRSGAVQVSFRSPDESGKSGAANAEFFGDDKPAATTRPNVPRSVLVGTSLKTQMSGPSEIALGATGDFVVRVSNPTNATFENVDVRLDLPISLDIILMDRHARVDQVNRSVTWDLPTLRAGEEVLIRYRVQATMQGKIQQQIRVSAANSIATE